MSKEPIYKNNKIDYSKYFLKNYIAYTSPEKNSDFRQKFNDEYQPEVDMKKSNNQYNQSPCPQTSSNKTKPKGIYATIMILLCFLITVISTNLLTNGFLMQELFAFKDADNKASYYALVGKAYNSREEALPEAILIRQGGGCSYILEENKVYYVVYSMYLDKESAKAVQAKNTNTQILRLDVKNIENKEIEGALFQELNNIAEVFESTIERLNTLITNLQKSNITFFEAQIEIGEIKSPLIILKQNLYLNESLKKSEKDFMLLQIETVLGCVESVITSNPSPVNLLSDIRYIQTHTIRVYQNLFKFFPSN